MGECSFLLMDPSTNMPIVVLKDVGSDAVMPIWVGIFEGERDSAGNREGVCCATADARPDTETSSAT